MPRFNISSPPGSLPVVYSVPLQTDGVPAATVSSFIAYALAQILPVPMTGISGSFQPYAPVATADSAYTRSPRLSVGEELVPHYGRALLFTKAVGTALTMTLFVTAKVALYDYDGSLEVAEKMTATGLLAQFVPSEKIEEVDSDCD